MLFLTTILYFIDAQYYFQSKAPWFHSCRSPTKRIKMKNVNRVRVWAQFIDVRIIGRGITRVISTSKIKNTTAIK